MEKKNYTLKEKVSQLLCFAFHGTSYNKQIEMQIKEMKIGGIIYFSRNVENTTQVKELNEKIQKESEIPMFIGIDQEGGIVQRIIDDITPFPQAMSNSASMIDSYEISKMVGSDLKELGFNMNYAPVGDCNNNPLNPVINSRSYSDDPKVCAKYVIDSCKGFMDANIIPTVKHFPGHGDTSLDSHIALPKVTKTYEELKQVEFYPFEEAIKSGACGVMASHVLYEKLDDTFPATLSKKILTNILKEEMNFKGLIVTDSLTMGAINANYTYNEIVRNCVNAGVDLMIFCGKADMESQRQIYNALLEETENGNIDINRINESFEKIMKFKEKYCNNNVLQYQKEEKEKLGKEISRKSITLVKDENVLPVKEKVLVIFPKIKVFSLVDNDNQDYVSLGNILKENGIENDEIIYDNTTNILKKVLNISKVYDKILLATYNVSKNDYQTEVFEILPKDKTIVISMRSPYDILYLNGAKCYITIYETSVLAFNSLALALKENKFYGKLPVKL